MIKQNEEQIFSNIIHRKTNMKVYSFIYFLIKHATENDLIDVSLGQRNVFPLPEYNVFVFSSRGHILPPQRV